MPEILKSKPILIHLSAWGVGGLCLGLSALGLDIMLIGCGVTGWVAFFSGFIVLPTALMDLLPSSGKPLRVRLQLAAVALMATLVLVCGVALQILTEGRH